MFKMIDPIIIKDHTKLVIITLVSFMMLLSLSVLVACSTPTSTTTSAPASTTASAPASTKTSAPESTPARPPEETSALAPVPETVAKPTVAPTPTAKPKPKGPIKAIWIDPEIIGDTVSIPVNKVVSNWNTHFPLKIQGNSMNFMAYNLDGEVYVRANVCPPCRSVGFSLEKDNLVCDRCGTMFEAETGDGIKGACVDYPKEAVSFKTVNGNIIMNATDLVTAYQETVKRG